MRRKTLSQPVRYRGDNNRNISLVLYLLPLIRELASAVLEYLQQRAEKIASPGTRLLVPVPRGRRVISPVAKALRPALTHVSAHLRY